MTPAEIGRNIARIDASLNTLRAEAVPLTVWDAEHRALSDKLHRHEKSADESRQRLERDIEELRRDYERELTALRREMNARFEAQASERKQNREFRWSRGLGLAVALATIIGVIVAAYAASKGVH